MNKLPLTIWGRDFVLSVNYQNYPGEEITKNQQETEKAITSVDFNAARAGVERYIRRYFASNLGNEDFDNIFRFVMPKNILILRSGDSRMFAVMCKFKFDMEHGIAVVYKNEGFVAAGPQDLAL